MRLICPNCGAQYEVADDVIPSGGRDVQCSNCSHTWFERPGESLAAEREAPRPRPRPSRPKPPPPGPNLNSEPEEDPDDVPDLTAPEPKPQADAPYSGSIQEAFADVAKDKPQRRPIDASVADILREEAALEAAARRRETPDPLESQDELALPETTPPKPAARDPQIAAAVAETVAAASRRELLPDIEEINSTLRSSTERGEPTVVEPDEQAEETRRGFRFGFTTVLGILLVLAIFYVFAEQISTAAPVLTDTLTAYVALVDSGRLWLDLKMQDLLTSMQSEGGQ